MRLKLCLLALMALRGTTLSSVQDASLESADAQITPSVTQPGNRVELAGGPNGIVQHIEGDIHTLQFLVDQARIEAEAIEAEAAEEKLDDVRSRYKNLKGYMADAGNVASSLEGAIAEAQGGHNSSNALARWLELATNAKDVAKETRQFLSSLRICADCNSFARYGEEHDGGYMMCEDDLDGKRFNGAYSYGINGFDGWGMSLAERNHVPLFEYDCINPAEPEICSDCEVHFHRECIAPSGQEFPRYRSLQKQLADNGHGDAADGSLLLKLDIEGAEWPILAAEPEEVLRKFGQVIVEFHELHKSSKHSQYLQAVQNLLSSGLSIVHLHANNCCGMVYYGSLSVPIDVEVTFVRRAPETTKCHDPVYLKDLDAPNIPRRAEINEFKLAAL